MLNVPCCSLAVADMYWGVYSRMGVRIRGSTFCKASVYGWFHLLADDDWGWLLPGSLRIFTRRIDCRFVNQGQWTYCKE